MKNARITAVQALARLHTANAYSNLVLEPMIKQNGLSARDGAFASALFYGVLERQLTLDYILRQHSSQKLEKLSPVVLETLRLGIYQLLYMDGVDDYAAVSESVELVKKLGVSKASGFVNAVLRSFLRDEKRILPVKGNVTAQWEVEYSCPGWLIDAWRKAYGDQAAKRLLASSLGKPPVYLRVNTLKTTPEKLKILLEEQGVVGKICEELKNCIEVLGRINVEELPSFKEGFFHVQDKSSQLCAQALQAQPGQRTLDVCCAPGGKTFTIAQLMENRGEILARDLHEKRAGLVEKGAQRLGITIVKAGAGDAAVYEPALGKFDRVLCDVPCSGFGIIRRKPEIKYKSPQMVENLPEIQYKILKTSSQYLKEDGILVYSTCTLLPQENERVVERFLREQPQFQLEFQKSFIGEKMDTDGFFVARLKKAGGKE